MRYRKGATLPRAVILGTDVTSRTTNNIIKGKYLFGVPKVYINAPIVFTFPQKRGTILMQGGYFPQINVTQKT